MSTLDQRIAAAFSSDIASADLAQLIGEAEAAAAAADAAAEREKAQDASIVGIRSVERCSDMGSPEHDLVG